MVSTTSERIFRKAKTILVMKSSSPFHSSSSVRQSLRLGLADAFGTFDLEIGLRVDCQGIPNAVWGGNLVAV